MSGDLIHQPETTPKTLVKNRYNLLEIAGSFGDLGTLLPFVLSYISILKFNPVSVLFGFGVFNIMTGLFYKTPIPVQPMKAIGSFAIAHPGQVSQGMITGAGLFSGLFWLFMSFTGLIKHIEKLFKSSVVKGIMLGLGMSFMMEGIKMMSKGPLLAIIAIALFFVLHRQTKVPVILVLLVFGVSAEILVKPQLLKEIMQIKLSFQIPAINLEPFKFKDFMAGVVFLALPQLPLTIGNGVIAVVAENNELFPDRRITTQRAAMSTGLMNILSPWWGGVPLCHGAGGMAAHVRFGARTGGATVMLGAILLIMALFFGKSLTVLLQLFPMAVLGVILFLAGAELARSAYNRDGSRRDFYIVVATAGTALWNAGAALVVGFLLDLFLKEEPMDKTAAE